MSFKPVSVSKLLPLDKLASQLGITYVDSGKNYAVIEIILDDRHLNFMGRCHGGVVFSLADTAFGLASNMGGNLSLAIDAHITFIKGASFGDVLRAHARRIAVSRKTAVYRTDVCRDEEVIATFTGTVFLTNKELSEHLPSHGTVKS